VTPLSHSSPRCRGKVFLGNLVPFGGETLHTEVKVKGNELRAVPRGAAGTRLRWGVPVGGVGCGGCVLGDPLPRPRAQDGHGADLPQTVHF